MSKFVLSPYAQNDFREIKSYYIREAGREVAQMMLAELRQAIRDLADRPGIGHKRTDLAADDILFWPVRSYLIVYRRQPKRIEIVGVLHGARDIPSILPYR